jgi:hypothetical protein
MPSVIFSVVAAATFFLRRADKEQGRPLLGLNPLRVSAEESPLLFRVHLAGYWLLTIIFGSAALAFFTEFLGILS